MQEKLKGITGVYVADTIAIGDDECIKESKLTEQRIKIRPREFDKFTFAEKNISKQGKDYEINQRIYANKLKILSMDFIFE